MQDWVPSRFWFYARSRLYLECWHLLIIGICEGKPQILSLNGSKPKVPHWYVVWLGTATTSKSLFTLINLHLPLFLGVLGGEASQGMPITYKKIYIYTHTRTYTNIYIYVSKYMLYCKYTYIHNTHCSSTGHASQDSTGAFAETLLCASESWDRWQLIW